MYEQCTNQEKTANIILEIERLNLDILGISEVRWARNNRININQYEFIYAGGNKHEHGVGIMIKKDAMPYD